MQTRRFISGKVAATTAVALIALAGCEVAGFGAPEPLEESPERVRVCTPQPSDGRATLGVDVTNNVSPSDLVVRAVKLKHPHGMKILDAKIMFIPKDSTQSLIGFWNGWPPRLDKTETDVRRAFARSPDAVGTVLPGNNEQTIAIVVGVAVRPDRWSGPIEIQYEDDRGRRYTWTGPTRFRTENGECRSGDLDE